MRRARVHRLLLTAFLPLLAFASAGFAQSTGFAFLRLGAGARDAALAEATTALSGTQATAANPAALTAQRAAALSHTEWVGDVRHEHAVLTWARPGGGAIAVDLRLGHTGGLERRTGPSTESLGDFGIYEWTAGVAWARPLTPRLRAGVGAYLARQSIDADAASGGIVDAGLVYGEGPWWLAAAVRNLGRMNDLDREATDLPRQLRLGGATVRGPLLLSADVHWTRGEDASLHIGGEYRPHPHLVLRAGTQTADTRDLAAGLGVDVGDWGVDYAYIPFSDGLGSAHRVSLLWHGGEMRP